MTENERPRVSVLIVNYNGEKLLPACLNSVVSAVGDFADVVVVDNGSCDKSIEILNRFGGIRVVRNNENLGFAGGNNTGLAACSGDYVLLLNNDTIVPPGFLQVLCQYLDHNQNVGALQGKMVLPAFGNTLDTCGSFLTAFGLPYHYGLYKEDRSEYQQNYPIFSGKGACLMFRRQLIQQVGGFLFDEDFFCYYEETDFCHRVWLAGYEVHFVASPAIQHFMGATAGGAQSAFVLRHYLRNMSFSLNSNLSFASRLRILPAFYAILAAVVLASALTLRWGTFTAAIGAIFWRWNQRKKIRLRRKLIKTIRQRSDKEIFKKVLRTPRLSYFAKTFTGNLGAYKDERLS